MMKRLAPALLATLCLAAPALRAGEGCCPNEARAAKSAEKDWSHHMGGLPFVVGYEKGMAKAKADKKAVMVFTTTTWCGWCTKLAQDTFSNPDVRKALEPFVFVLVDGDVEKDVVQKFGVKGFPNLRFQTVDETELGTIGGYRKPAKFLEELRPILAKLKA